MIGRFQAGVAFVEGLRFLRRRGAPAPLHCGRRERGARDRPEGRRSSRRRQRTHRAPPVHGDGVPRRPDGHPLHESGISRSPGEERSGQRAGREGLRAPRTLRYFPAEKGPFTSGRRLSEEAERSLVAATSVAGNCRSSRSTREASRRPGSRSSSSATRPARRSPAGIDEKVLKTVLDAAGGTTRRCRRAGPPRSSPAALDPGAPLRRPPGRLTYDAQETLGGSGGPVLSAQGRSSASTPPS